MPKRLKMILAVSELRASACGRFLQLGFDSLASVIEKAAAKILYIVGEDRPICRYSGL